PAAALSRRARGGGAGAAGADASSRRRRVRPVDEAEALAAVHVALGALHVADEVREIAQARRGISARDDGHGAGVHRHHLARGERAAVALAPGEILAGAIGDGGWIDALEVLHGERR